ncbi:hypothetical protein H0H81_008928 [Sphagnurus paluster]|uniref:DNA2/NAM7 helicase-like C-terminal domain-containing protein n=1 Tax=Sphagnurus paluster TaxID=117069 RepID=A0A9P7KIW7_9AGAR|nr:hypothetical protein H0H81_008928 [Sphagnurus paluster]
MAPLNRPMTLMQTLVDGAEFSLIKIPVTKVKELDITTDTFSAFDHARPLGISPGYSSAGRLVALAITDNEQCMIIEFNIAPRPFRDRAGKSSRPKSPPPRNLEELQQKILCRPAGELFAFDMGPLSMSLYNDAQLRIKSAVDIQSGLSAMDRKPLTAIKEILGTSALVKELNVASVFHLPVYEPDERKSATDLAMRAWISQFLAEYGNGADTLAKVRRINTEEFSVQKLNMIAKIANDSLRQDQLKPTKTTHEATFVTDSTGQTTVQSQTFKNRLRSDMNIRYNVPVEGRSGYTSRGQVGSVLGKSAPLVTDRSLDAATRRTTIVTSIGRDDPTTAEAHRAATVLRILQGFDELLSDSPWIKNIWFPEDTDKPLQWPLSWSDLSPATPSRSSTIPTNPPPVLLSLNSSQQVAVNTMYSPLDKHRITIIQGPPGTGKTSVIASYVQFAIQTGDSGIWLVAQSNVAVKNIAEKLVKTGFHEWKLLISKDFVFEWHEHIYTQIKAENIIRSDRFKSVRPKTLSNCKVILCTLSMLSNINIPVFTRLVPIKTLIVDEASQIEIGNYMAVLSSCRTLRKVCFIGDDKQLPPFGQEDLQDLQSIFEVPHLRPHALFLNIQYRMPPQIGAIISDLVYDGKLNSNPKHPITEEIIACRFIDIPGHEKVKENSYMNELECEAVIKLAEKLQEQQKAYQIITPYEGQRSTIESEMKNMPNLSWENKCFNEMKKTTSLFLLFVLEILDS